MEFTTESHKPHIALFPLCTAMGHLIPMAELAKRLCVHHGFSITFITSNWRSTDPQTTFIQRLASCGLDIRVTELSHEDLDQHDQKMKIQSIVSKYVENAKPQVEGILQSSLTSPSPICAFVTDFFCTAMLDITNRLQIPTYIFFPSSASALCLMLYLPKLASEIQVSFKDSDFEVKIPGLPPIPSKDMPASIQDRSDDMFFWFLQHSLRFREASGILVNSFEEFEEQPIRALVEGKVLGPSIYPVGPIILSESYRSENSDCLKWLDQQPLASVIFISFGSGAVLPTSQIKELAAGIEASGHRFLWVVRGPFKTIGSSLVPESDLSQLLPGGFENRTKDRGLVVPDWAPQIPVLSHPSIGGFLSHCGWNSTLESLTHGVPMIGWPLFAEQRMNRLLLVNEMKVAVEVKMESDGFVRREEVQRAVRELMEGEGGRRARERMKEMREKARVAMAEGGSSFKGLASAAAEFVQKAGDES